jgi:hypothetical protein
LPLFYLVVKGGDIYIDRGVSQLDGIYIAEPDSNGRGGHIYTCAGPDPANPGSDIPYDTSSTDLFSASTCQNPLTVNGAFVAKDTYFWRSNGSYYKQDGAAETFNYVPMLWLANPYDPTADSGFNSLSNLPPVL